MKFHEVLKNYMLPEPVVGSWNDLWINMDVWKKLTPQQQEIIKSAAYTGGGLFAFNDTRMHTQLALTEMESLMAISTVKKNTVASLAVRLGPVRLIDNMKIA